MKENKVLIVSVAMGGGHINIGNSLYSLFSLYNPTQHYIAPRKFADKIYRRLVKLNLYEYLFKLFKVWNPMMMNVGIGLEFANLKKEIDNFQPSVIICTHPRHTRAVKALKKLFKYKYRIVSVVCDYGDQLPYVYGVGKIDYYLVRDEYTKKYIQNYVDEKKIIKFGTKVSDVFLQAKTKDNFDIIKDYFELSNIPFYFDKNKKSIFIVGGSGWARKSLPLIKKLAQSKKYNLFVSCGKDKKLFNILGEYKINRLQFVDQDILANLENLVDLAIFTSFGPSTMLEFMTINKYPLFVHNHLSGQETENVKILSQRGIGIYEKDDDKIIGLVEDYFSDPKKYDYMLENQRKVADENLRLAYENVISLRKILD